jgi:exopolysaccharide biosynthesis polyprenyl glycosylphosphotransferase
MLLHRIRGLWNAYHGFLAVVLTVVFWAYLVSVAVVFGGITEGYPRFILYNLAGVVGLAISAIRGRSAAARLLAGGFVECHTLAVKQIVYVGVTILVVFVAAMDPEVSRFLKLSLLFGFLGILYLVFLLCHLVVPKRLADALFSSEEYEQRTLLIGPVEKARGISKWIEETAAFGFGMKGSVRTDDDEEEESRILHVSRVSDVSMLERIIRNEGIKQILLLEIPLDPEALGLVVNAANKAGVRLLVVNNLDEIFNHDITLFNLHDKRFIGLRDEPLEDPVSRILKRTMDLAFSLPVVLFVLPPLCLVVKIFQAMQSPGPLFYRQTRAGLGNRPFRIFKFRTMRIDQEDTSSKQATAGDPRIYPMGRILRKTSLDEIPQFLNVFFGDMSVVGPRPHMIIHNRRFSEIMDKYHVRTFAKPGITGLAQMSGYRGEAKNDEDVIERAKLDIKYIEDWSLPLDFWIIFKTMLQVVKPPKTAS